MSDETMPICDDGLKIIYKHGAPYGIRDRGGFLFFFCGVQKYNGQEERYRQEIEQQYKLADHLLNALSSTKTSLINEKRDELLERVGKSKFIETLEGYQADYNQGVDDVLEIINEIYK